MKNRDKLFWLLWLILALTLLWYFAKVAAYGMPPVPKFPHHSKNVTPMPTQGLGAAALLIPKAVIVPPRFIYPPYYFSVTSRSGDMESGFSNEVSITNMLTWSNGMPRTLKAVTLAWNASGGTEITYTVHRGRSSGVYTNDFPAGTNLTLTVPLYGPVLTNVVVTVTSQNATNLQWATAIGKPWTLYGATNYTATNPPMRIWRGVGRSAVTRPQVFIQATRQ